MKYLIVKRKTDVRLKTSHIFTIWVTCKKLYPAFVRTTTKELVCNCLLLKLHITTQQKICPQPSIKMIKKLQKLLETVKNYCFSIIDSDIKHCPWCLKYQYKNKIFKVFLISFPSKFKGNSSKNKIKLSWSINGRKQHFLKVPLKQPKSSS